MDGTSAPVGQQRSAYRRTFWFARLDDALDRGDYEQAGEAQRELRRLGVSVRYAPAPIRRATNAR